MPLYDFGCQSCENRFEELQRLEAPPRAPSHMLLRVALPSRGDDEADLESFLVDAGFGGHLLGAPLKLEPGLVQATPGGVERLTQAGETFTLEALLPDGWAPAYRFTLAPLAPVDYEPLNWFTATHPDSFFRHNLRLERLTPQQRAGLLNDRLTLRPAIGEATVRRLESAADFAEVLETVFALTPPIAADELFERVPKGLDGPFVPG